MSPRPPRHATTWRGRALDTGYRRVLRPVLFGSYGGDAERVHERTLTALERVGNLRPALRTLSALTQAPRRPVTVAGIDFPGVVGVAAGLDKNGLGLKTWSSLGFGHAELGTVTAAAQPGNPKPRLFRLRQSQAIINRMGFNNLGAAALAERLRSAGVQRGNGAVGMPLGVSIGKTKTTPLGEATEDYLTSFRLVAPYADYVAINVSSPNTPGLRSLQDHAALQELVVELVAEAQLLAGREGTPVPLFVKLAPDLTDAALDELLEVCLDGGVSGLIATNTTLSRDGIDPADVGWADQAGGLSGAPLRTRARDVVAYLTSRTELPVIGVGGILTADDAIAMLDAGARLVQLYTGYIYAGPALVSSINQLTARSPL
ncbi:MAG: quinone-dependent dihydroorotate dehydrogenase [Propionibacteriaceae bacterium]